MFSPDDYIGEPVEPVGRLEVDRDDGCIWIGALYERKSGGFDLFYVHDASVFSPLLPEQITKLRELCAGEGSPWDGGVCFVARLNSRNLNRELFSQAEEQLSEWISAVIGS